MKSLHLGRRKQWPRPERKAFHRQPTVESLEARLLLAFTINHTPYLQLGNAPLEGYNAGTDQAEVIWQTTGVADTDTFTSEFRETGAADWTSGNLNPQIITGVGGRINHSTTFTGLNFNDDYDYRITHLRGGSPIATYQSTFHTRLNVDASTGFTFATYGDSASDDPPSNFIAVQNQINALNPAFSLLLGDNVYSSGTHAEYDLRLDPSKNLPLTTYDKDHIDYFAFGNHDVGTNNGQAALDNYSMPIPVEGVTSAAGITFDSAVQAEKNYSYDYGNAHFVTFDTNNWTDPTALDKQLNWAVTDIQAARARVDPPKWVIIFGHHPITSLAGHTEHTPDDYYYDQVLSRLGSGPGGVGADLLLFGHTHNYQRSYPLTGHVGATATYVLDTDNNYAKGAGLPLVIQGTGGVENGYGANDASFAGTYLAKAIDSNTTVPEQYGFGRVDVTANQLTYRYISVLGQTLDTFTITDGGDTTGPRASLASPGDNGAADSNPLVNQATLTTSPANLQLRLWDIGQGVNDATVTSAALSVTRNGVPLVAGTHFNFAYNPTANIITLTPVGSSFGNGTYNITVGPSISDLAGNALASTSLSVVVNAGFSPITVNFRNGENGFGGAKDTYVHEDDPTTNHGSDVKVNSDGDDDLGTAETPPQHVQGLIRFDSMFNTVSGSRGGGPIPDGSTIVSATLTVRTGTASGDESPAGNLFTLHRMIATWSETSTWDGLVGGVSLDNVEASSTITASVNGPATLGGTVSFDVTADMQLWSNNNSLSTRGWVVNPTTGTNGWWFESSNAATIGNRPILSVIYRNGPTGVLAGGPHTMDEGNSLTLNGSATGTGLSYTWDLNGDNVFGDAIGAAPTLSWGQLETLGLNDGTSTHVIAMRVTDTLGVQVTDTTWLTINNSLPSASIVGPPPKRGELTSFILSATDPSSADQAAPFTFDVDWNDDGIFDQTVVGTSGTSVGHLFNEEGATNIRVRATDKDGGVSSVTTVPITVIGHELIAGDLYWYGSTGADTVHFEQVDPSTVRVAETMENGAVISTSVDVSGVTGRVIAAARAGDDTLNAILLTSTSVTFDGGADNDSLVGGTAADILAGGSGLDTIWGGFGSDNISGGSDSDVIYGDYPTAAGKVLSKTTLGADTITGGDGNDTLYGDGDGGEGAGDSILGDDGNDTIFADGSEGADTLAADFVDGGADNDTITSDGGEGSPDTVFGSGGDDLINAGGGNDSADGGDGNDILLGGIFDAGGSDTLLGGDGRDILVGDGGVKNPTVKTGGIDSISGGAGEDLIVTGFVDATLPATFSWIDIRAEWLSGAPIAVRRDHILGNSIGLNGTSTLVEGITLFSDKPASNPAPMIDIVFGGTEDDWILLDATEESVGDLELGDIIDDIS